MNIEARPPAVRFTDQQIHAAYVADNPAAGELLFRTYYDVLVKYSGRLSPDLGIAEDVAMETLFRVHTRLAAHTHNATNLLSFMRRIAHNLVVDQMRSGDLRHEISFDAARNSAYAGFSISAEDAYFRMARRLEIFNLVEKNFKGDRYRVWSLVLQGEKQRDIATILDIPIEAVRTHVNGGTRFIKHHFTRNKEYMLHDTVIDPEQAKEKGKKNR